MRRGIPFIILSACIVFIILSIPTIAQEKKTAGANEVKEVKAAPTEMPLNDSVSFLKSFMALAFVLGLIFLAAYFYKKMAGIKTSGIRTHRVPIYLKGSLPLGEKKYLAVVEVQGNHYFIGISQESIHLLDKFEIELTEENTEESSRDFENIFAKARALLQNRIKK